MKKIILPLGSILLAVCLMMPAILEMTGCGTPQKTTYTAIAATPVTVETALGFYNELAKAGKTTVAQNQKVKAAYLKYQASFAVVCDLGAVYAATSGTNTPAASAALQQAVLNMGATIGDFQNLLTSFGVKLK